MTGEITLSDKTKQLINKAEQLHDDLIDIPHDFAGSSPIAQQHLVEWIGKTINTNKQTLFLLESLRLSMLIDLYDSLPGTKVPPDIIEKASWFARFKFILLAIAGTIYVGCEGFDGISAILAITTLPSSIIFIAGMLFSLLSIMVFFAFDLVEISKNLGVQLRNTPKLVDVYLQQINSINAIITVIDETLAHKNRDEIDDDLSIIAMLQERRAFINEASQSLKKALESPALKIAKAMAACIAGIIFFSGGYFVGQTVSLAIIGFFIASATPAFWPVIVMSALIGLAAFSLYWFVERPGIENLIGRLSGLDKEKIDTLCDTTIADNELTSIRTLKNKLQLKSSELNERIVKDEKIIVLEQQLKTLKQENSDLQKALSSSVAKLQPEDNNYHLSLYFFQPSSQANGIMAASNPLLPIPINGVAEIPQVVSNVSNT